MGINGIRKAVFLDRDGVINPHCGIDEQGHPESPLHFFDFQVFPFVAPSIKKLNELGYAVFVVSNQPAYAKGKMSFGELMKMNVFLRDLLAQNGAILHEIYCCLHHPDPVQVVRKTLLVECNCRKPKPGMLYQARAEHGIDLSKSWMVGDSSKDVGAGKAAGCKTILVLSDRMEKCQPDFTATDLTEAVQIIQSEVKNE
jgi:histidinol-phosphate phosphatase family protein